MTLVDRISEAAKEQGITFKALERETGLGNGTIKRWETQSPRLDKLMKVSEYLHISLDYLAFGGSCSATCDGKELTDDESDLIAMYRLIEDASKETVVDMVTMFYEKATGKRASIYSTYTDDKDAQKSGPDDDGAHRGTA